MDPSLNAIIIDDNTYNRQIFRTILEAVGYQVEDYAYPIEGLEALKDRLFHILILDLQMPGMNGRTVLHRIRSEAQYDTMTVVVVTAFPHLENSEINEQAYVMHKPIDVASFRKFIERLYNHSQTDANDKV